MAIGEADAAVRVVHENGRPFMVVKDSSANPLEFQCGDRSCTIEMNRIQEFYALKITSKDPVLFKGLTETAARSWRNRVNVISPLTHDDQLVMISRDPELLALCFAKCLDEKKEPYFGKDRERSLRMVVHNALKLHVHGLPLQCPERF